MSNNKCSRPYCRIWCTITEMRADCLYLAGKRCIYVLYVSYRALTESKQPFRRTQFPATEYNLSNTLFENVVKVLWLLSLLTAMHLVGHICNQNTSETSSIKQKPLEALKCRVAKGFPSIQGVSSMGCTFRYQWAECCHVTIGSFQTT